LPRTCLTWLGVIWSRTPARPCCRRIRPDAGVTAAERQVAASAATRTTRPRSFIEGTAYPLGRTTVLVVAHGPRQAANFLRDARPAAPPGGLLRRLPPARTRGRAARPQPDRADRRWQAHRVAELLGRGLLPVPAARREARDRTPARAPAVAVREGARHGAR